MPIYPSKSGYGYTYKKEKIRQTVVRGKGKKKSKFAVFFILGIVAMITSFFVVKLLPQLYNQTTNQVGQLYALNILTTSDYADAMNISSYVKNQGASGYIYNDNNIYKVLLSCYENKQDADKVVNSLSENGYKVSIETLEFKKLKNKDEMLLSAISCFYDSYKSLYKLSTEFDKNNLSQKDFVTQVNMIISTNEQIINDFNSYYQNVSKNEIIFTRIYLEMLQNNLNELANKNHNLSSEIKSHYFYVVFLYKQLLQNI